MVSGDEMENTSFNHEDKEYGETMDVLVNCAGGDCIPTEALRLALFLLLVAFFLVGMPGNVILAWVTKLGTLQNINTFWFYHLSLADMYCCLSVPVLVLPIALRGHWPYGVTGCRALPFVISLSMDYKVLLLTLLSLDTFLLFLKPTWWTENRRLYWVRVARLAAWIFALMLAVSLDVYHRVLLEPYPSQLECMLDDSSSMVATSTVTTIQFIFVFLVPLVVMASCHSALLCHEGRHCWPLGMAAAVCFLVCWAPYHVLGLIITMGARSSTLWTRALLAEPFVMGLALAHICLNPLLILYFGRAHLCRSLTAACQLALKDPAGKNESVINKNSSSHDQVSEMERLERN